MLQIKLGDMRDVDPATDPLGRSRVGSWEGMTEWEAWEVGRSSWPMNTDNLRNEGEVQIISPDQRVLARAVLTGFTRDPFDPTRVTLEGRLIPGHRAVGQPTSHPHNPRSTFIYV